MGLEFRGIPVPFLTTPEFRVEFRGIPVAEFRSVEFRILLLAASELGKLMVSRVKGHKKEFLIG
jgi:hypothetical protein